MVSTEWDRWARKPGNAVKAATVSDTILDDDFWQTVRMFCKLLKPIVKLMRLVDSNMPSMGKVSCSSFRIWFHSNSLEHVLAAISY